MPTGVPGLDHVLMGGFLREGFYLVQGGPGTGKTTLALQFVFNRRQAGERCLYITLTESRKDLENTCRSPSLDSPADRPATVAAPSALATMLARTQGLSPSGG